MNVLKRFDIRAYHRGFQDGNNGRPFNPPRLFARGYTFGYEWAHAYKMPRFGEPMTEADYAYRKQLQRDLKHKWFPELVKEPR